MSAAVSFHVHYQCSACLYVSARKISICPSCSSILTMKQASEEVVARFMRRQRLASSIVRDADGKIVEGGRDLVVADEPDTDDEDDDDLEEVDDDEDEDEGDDDDNRPSVKAAKVKRAGDIRAGELKRLSVGHETFDHVLGGGVPEHNCLMLAASPGTGKTTLFVECGVSMAEDGLNVMLASGEQSEKTLKRMMRRLKLHERFPRGAGELMIVESDDPDAIVAAAHENDVDVLLVDSLMVMKSKRESGPPGKEKQLNYCAKLFQDASHASGPYKRKKPMTVLTICHATKGSDMAGSNTAKHWTDGAFYMEHVDPMTMEPSENQNISTGYVRLRVHGKYREGDPTIMGLMRMTKEGLVNFDPDADSDSDSEENDEETEVKASRRAKRPARGERKSRTRRS